MIDSCRLQVGLSLEWQLSTRTRQSTPTSAIHSPATVLVSSTISALTRKRVSSLRSATWWQHRAVTSSTWPLPTRCVRRRCNRFNRFRSKAMKRRENWWWNSLIIFNVTRPTLFAFSPWDNNNFPHWNPQMFVNWITVFDLISGQSA